MTDLTKDWLDKQLRLIRDAGAMDDNMGAEDWSASDLAIEKAKQAITDKLRNCRVEELRWVKNKLDLNTFDAQRLKDRIAELKKGKI